MDKNYKLRIFIYGKEALNDIKYICNTIVTKFHKDYKYKVKPYCSIDKESGWEYFIFSRDIDGDGNEAIKKYLNDHYKAKNIIKADDEIKKIIEKHQDNAYNELNEKISNVLLEYLNFYDILVISVDNLLDENSKTAFKFFQGFTKNKCQQLFILFFDKKR